MSEQCAAGLVLAPVGEWTNMKPVHRHMDGSICNHSPREPDRGDGSDGTLLSRLVDWMPHDYECSAGDIQLDGTFPPCDCGRDMMLESVGDRLHSLRSQLSDSLQRAEGLEQRIRELEGERNEWENREASCCPEDVGFDEYIRTLEARLGKQEGPWSGKRWSNAGFLRAEIMRLGGELSAAEARAEAAERDAAEGKKDRERLDWLETSAYRHRVEILEQFETQGIAVYCTDGESWSDVEGLGLSLRAAIDAARLSSSTSRDGSTDA